MTTGQVTEVEAGMEAKETGNLGSKNDDAQVVMRVREPETTQTRQIPNPAQKTLDEKNERWKAVRGKSAIKSTQATT